MHARESPVPKTLGRRSAELVAMLHEKGRPVFTLGEVREITGLGAASARSLMRKLVGRGIVTRLRSGLYNLVPFELGREGEYLGNPFVVARELAGDRDYFLSHASAMEIHGMVTQPQLVVCATSPVAMRSVRILGTEFRFVRCKAVDVFGRTEHWIEKRERVVVSDLERTVIDGLRLPQHCGGVTEVAKGLWMRRGDMSAEKLVDYALRLGVGAVIRRLGYLMEAYRIGESGELARLRGQLTSTYCRLDPVLPAEGRFLAHWRLRLNVSPEEIQAVVGA
jgi:predicted transcriptional regulator of viral defense system